MPAFLSARASRLLLLAALLLPAACDTPAERAETHYQRALALLQQGDAPRAMLEFRNVFRLDPTHTAARFAYAEALKDTGQTNEALSQFLRLTEQEPKNLAAQREAVTLALEVGDLETAAMHGAEAYALAPDDLEVRALKATVDYRTDRDRPGAVALAQAVVAEDPTRVDAQMVLIADRMADGKPEAALALIDAALSHAPKDEGLHLARLKALGSLDDDPAGGLDVPSAIGAELQASAALFPGNVGVRAALVRWYLAQGNADGAEAVLRAALVDPATGAPLSDPLPALTLVRFLNDVRGPAAARAELDRQIATAANPAPFRRAAAGLDFASGDTAGAIAAMRSLLATATDPEETRMLQVGLAGMLLETGETAESTTLLDGVLAQDRDNVDALKLRAQLALTADKPETAVQDLRTALAQAPQDASVLTLLALAYERQGAHELAGESLARAVEATQQGPAELLRYADFLLRDGRVGPAEAVLNGALRITPDDPDLLGLLGELHLSRHDWARVAQVAATLRATGDPGAVARADDLETASLAGQGRTEETFARLAERAPGDPAALAALVRGRLEAGDTAGAQAAIAAALAADPGNPAARLLEAEMAAAGGDAAGAVALYAALVRETPDLPEAWRAYAAFLGASGRPEEAAAVLEAGLAANPGDPGLLLAQAGLAEARGDTGSAIALYETLYGMDPSAPLVANNLASLLATGLAATGGDPASLERAADIARRLRGTDVPPFQDTYGWILFLRGDAAQALDYLGPAAEAMPEAAEVQFHRAEAEFALGRWEAAGASYDRALAAAAAGSPLPQAALVGERRAALAARSGAPAAPANDPANGPVSGSNGG